MWKFFVAGQENFTNILEQIHDFLMSKYRIFILDKEDDSLSKSYSRTGE
jgi:hypothetical protein